MKKFNYFLLTLATLLFTTFESKAFTTVTAGSASTLEINDIQPQLTQNNFIINPLIYSKLEIRELDFSTVNSVDLIESNLTFLYSLCLALVLINLIVQVKIIYQMIHLFFQFRKKDEFAISNI